MPLGARGDAAQPVGDDRLGLALELDRLGRSHVHRVAHERVGRAPDDDLAGCGDGLEPRRDVDRVAHHDRLAGAARADDDRPGVDARPRLEGDATLGPQGAVEPFERLAHLGARAHGAQGVLVVRDRDPEYGHHRVADVLLDRAAVALDDLAHAREVAAHDVAQRFRVEPLAERRRAGHVGEQDGHRLARLAGRGSRRQGRAAVPAQPEACRVLLATRRTADHQPSVGSAGDEGEALFRGERVRGAPSTRRPWT